jgi:hypothetical protein
MKWEGNELRVVRIQEADTEYLQILSLHLPVEITENHK